MFEQDDDLDIYLFLNSIRSADGNILVDFSNPRSEAVLAGITDIVGGTAGQESWALLHAMRQLRTSGAVFDILPDDLIDSDRDKEWGAYCLILSPSGYPQHWLERLERFASFTR